MIESVDRVKCCNRKDRYFVSRGLVVLSLDLLMQQLSR